MTLGGLERGWASTGNLIGLAMNPMQQVGDMGIDAYEVKC